MAWTPLDDRLDSVDTVVSAAKRHVDQFPIIVKENSEQLRQYQEMVLESMGVHKEHNFLHELNSQIAEANVAKLPVRLCRRWAEFVEGKSKQPNWESFANWLEKEAKLCESKQWWKPEKREWRRFDSIRSDLPKSGLHRSTGNPVPGMFAGATQETSSGDEKMTKKCPVHNSTRQKCKKFKELPTFEKEKLVEVYKLCLSCLLLGHRLNKCNARNRCKVEGCAMRHHTLVHEVDLNTIEQSRARKAENWHWVKEPRNRLFRRVGKNLLISQRNRGISVITQCSRLRGWRSCVG